MAWRKISRYSFLWDQRSNRFSIELWLTAPNWRGPDQQQRAADHRFANLGAEEFAALCHMLRGDEDRLLYCDSATNVISTGIDVLQVPNGSA